MIGLLCTQTPGLGPAPQCCGRSGPAHELLPTYDWTSIDGGRCQVTRHRDDTLNQA